MAAKLYSCANIHQADLEGPLLARHDLFHRDQVRALNSKLVPGNRLDTILPPVLRVLLPVLHHAAHLLSKTRVQLIVRLQADLYINGFVAGGLSPLGNVLASCGGLSLGQDITVLGLFWVFENGQCEDTDVVAVVGDVGHRSGAGHRHDPGVLAAGLDGVRREVGEDQVGCVEGDPEEGGLRSEGWQVVDDVLIDGSLGFEMGDVPLALGVGN